MSLHHCKIMQGYVILPYLWETRAKLVIIKLVNIFPKLIWRFYQKLISVWSFFELQVKVAKKGNGDYHRMTEAVPTITVQKLVVGQLTNNIEGRIQTFRFQYKVIVLFHIKVKLLPWLCVKVVNLCKTHCLPNYQPFLLN